MRSLGSIAATALVLALGLAACSDSDGRPHKRTRTVTLLMVSPPNSLDPAVGHNSEALEAEWLAYTPLVTYSHSNGVPGTRVIPGLASQPPTITDEGRTYTFTLGPGLVYSDGEPVRASDFTWAVERTIRLRWPDAPQYITSRIVGAGAFAAGRARTISGIQADDASGQITIHLTAAYGPFENVLALPAMAPVPRTTPMRAQTTPPPGVGPYEFSQVVPGRSFTLVKNPRWRAIRIPGIPLGRVNTRVTITHDPAANALAVLGNTADVFDWPDQVPPQLLAQVSQQAAGRYEKVVTNATYLVFLNVTRPPFSSQLARQAVQKGLDDGQMKLVDPGGLQEGCFLLPPSLYGHPNTQCPGGNIFAGGNLSAARALVEQSGTEGARVTVWSPASSPARQWMAYYASFLRQLGFRPALHVVPDPRYNATVGRLKVHPQTGYALLSAGLPNPVDLYRWVAGDADPPGTLGQINDPYVNTQVSTLAPIPASNLSAIAGFWQEVDRYVAARAYLAVFGYRTFPRFVSDRLDRRALVFSPVFGLDWSSFQLK